MHKVLQKKIKNRNRLQKCNSGDISEWSVLKSEIESAKTVCIIKVHRNFVCLSPSVANRGRLKDFSLVRGFFTTQS